MCSVAVVNNSINWHLKVSIIMNTRLFIVYHFQQSSNTKISALIFSNYTTIIAGDGSMKSMTTGSNVVDSDSQSIEIIILRQLQQPRYHPTHDSNSINIFIFFVIYVIVVDMEAADRARRSAMDPWSNATGVVEMIARQLFGFFINRDFFRTNGAASSKERSVEVRVIVSV